jgi:alkanesulfonate monooxygenase SsuD/methylene tetrahydromethanopterin reductase-like flavin-dependent oxidoreductase (luciferase family)
MAVLVERVAAIRAIWTGEEAEYYGRYVDFDPICSWPKPVQRPHPPVLVGGNGPGTEDRVLAYGDGWMPQCGPLADVEELRRRAGPVPITLFGVPPRTGLLADADADADTGLFALTELTADAVLRRLDEFAELAAAAR